MNRELFNPKTIKRLTSNIAISDIQREAAESWLLLLDEGKLREETLNYFKFAEYILKDLLGYDIKTDLEHEKGKIEFSFNDKNGHPCLGIEAKGTKTKDLFAIQRGYRAGQKTPINQLWTYMGQNNFRYGIATNYKHFVLLDYEVGRLSTYHFFDFEDVRDNDKKLKEFIAIFSKSQIIDKGFIELLQKESVIEDLNFSKEFYKLFHETRLMLIEEFKDCQTQFVTEKEAIHFAQLFLNRLMFIFFAQDTSKLEKRMFQKYLIKSLSDEMSISKNSTLVSNMIKNFFIKLNEGATTPEEIFGFNGGLFKEEIPLKINFKDFHDPSFYHNILFHSRTTLEPKLDEKTSELITKYKGKLNPLINNLLTLASFDFNTEVSVNILGHIFEQSLNDIEALQEGTVSRRKKEGIYYTPEYITDYICRRAIIPYLSKSNVITTNELINEYSCDIGELETKFKNLKILDPACGSGAFLIKSVDILLEIHGAIQFYKQKTGQYETSKGKKEYSTMLRFSEESEAREIIEKNIFGVDINEESVEITKLSMFFKIAEINKKLLDLSNNIKCGNSLINDEDVDPKSFDWEREFPFKFDIIVGNPPYIRQELIKEYSNYLSKNYNSYAGKADLYIYFIEKAINLLNDGGRLGFITSGKFTEAKYGHEILQYICDNSEIDEIINLNDLEVFEGITAYPMILILNKHITKAYNFDYYSIEELDFVSLFSKLLTTKKNTIQINDFQENEFKLISQDVTKILRKINHNSITLENYCGLPLVGIKTGYNEGYLIDAVQSPVVRPYVFGRDIKKYGYIDPKNNILFPYEYEDGSNELIDINDYPDIRGFLEENIDRLKKRAVIKEGLITGNKTWYEYQQINKTLNFDSEFIVYPNVSLGNNFTLSKGNVIDMTGFIIPSNEKYLLAILNSKVVEFIMKIYAISRRGGYLEYKVQYLSRVPIRNPTSSIKHKIEGEVDAIMSLSKAKSTSQDKFYNRLLGNFNLKSLSKALKSFYELDFPVFCKELKKQKVKLSLEQQDEWEDYFNDRKKEIIVMNDEIRKLIAGIDQMVFDLYGLTESEIEFINNEIDT